MSGEGKKERRFPRRVFLGLTAGLVLGGAVSSLYHMLAPPKEKLITHTITPTPTTVTYTATQTVTPEPRKTFSGRGATKVKITVRKCFSTDEFAVYISPVKAPYEGPCPILREGQEFYVDAERPEIDARLMPGYFCPYAWDAIFPSAWEAYERGEVFDVWACPDGFRPVVLKLEWI